MARGNAQNSHIKAKKSMNLHMESALFFLLKIIIEQDLCLPLCQVCGEVFFHNLGE
jgi:hypothetical protein